MESIKRCETCENMGKTREKNKNIKMEEKNTNVLKVWKTKNSWGTKEEDKKTASPWRMRTGKCENDVSRETIGRGVKHEKEGVRELHK